MRLVATFMVVMTAVCASACLTSLSPSPPITPIGCDLTVPGACPCVSDSDCPGAPFFFCDPSRSVCVPTCTTSEHCNNRPTGFQLSQCNSALQCWCDQGECITAQCSIDAECQGACRDGRCVDAPRNEDVARCVITPDFAVVSVGGFVTFSVLASRADGSPVVIPGGANWSTTSTALSGTQQTGHEATFLGGATTTQPTAAVRATFGNTSCEAKVSVLPESVNPYERIISVVDERTGRPVPSAMVVVSREDGTIVMQNGLAFVETNPQGAVKLDIAVGETRAISIFHSGYGYQTLAKVPQAAGALRFALTRNPNDLYGGYRATFDGLPMNSNVQLARAGLSSAFDLTALKLTDEGEPTTPISARVGAAIEFNETPVPLGTMTSFATTPIKPTVAVAGVNGVCLDRQGITDEVQIAAGLCGTQSAWALTADLPLASFPIDLVFSDGFKFLPVLERLPLRHLGSSVQRDVQFSLAPPTMVNGVPDLTDVSRFLAIAHRFEDVPLGFSFVARTPKLPQFRGEYVDRVLTAGVALQPGRGAVPIGVGTALNKNPLDDSLDGVDGLPPNHFAVRMAPAHHGLEAAQLALISQARASRFPTLGAATSTLITRIVGGLRYDPTGDVFVEQSTTPFLSLAEGGRFDLRTRTFTLPMRTDATLVRVSFADARGRKWEVLADPNVPGFTLPAVPVIVADRVFRDPQSGTPSLITVQTQRFDEPVTSDRLVQFAEWVARPDLHDPLRFLTAWSSVEMRAAMVKFTMPANDGQTLAAAPTLSLAIEGVRLGQRSNENLLELRFVGGIQCPSAIVSEELSPGLVQVTLPSSCRGMNMTIEAELLDHMRMPLSPAVVARRVVTVN